jgi:uncharacterized cupredoxin-like copper-binding protein
MAGVNETPRPSIASALLGVSAMVAAAVGVVAVTVAVSGDDDGGVSTGGAPATGATATVELSEFAIDPDALTVGVSGELEVVNVGSVEHNLAIEGEDVRTLNLAGGESATLSVGDLAPGEYELLCELPGHADAGMRGTLTVSQGGAPAGGSDTAGGGGHAGEVDHQAMTDAMLETMAAFPAETRGVGNQLLEPTEILADGTKVYDLTMELADWEVEPGRVVEAWTFNGTVPAPRMELDVGDRVQVRVRNDLPLATDVHWHGVDVTNPNDGVAPLTQDLVEPGTSFTYEFRTDEQAVAMYHPHAHGHTLLPNGMFGAILVGDLRLPLGQTVGLEQVPADLQISQEIPIVLNDSGVIGYSLNCNSFPATEPYTGRVGDWILVHYYNEGTQIHPMHLHQFDQIVVAKDGYPLDAPYTVDTLNVAPGERYSVLVELDAPGARVWHCHILPHVERAEGMFGMVTALLVED